MEAAHRMLILTRRRDESIVIGGTITVLVVEIRGDKVRLGIEAPRDTSVHRAEIQDRIDRGLPDTKKGGSDGR